MYAIDRSPDDEAVMTAAKRAQLVRLCARMTGNWDAAEDLAQETLFEAWRNQDKLRRQDAWSPWVSGIARNVCRRWIEREARGRLLEQSDRLIPLDMADADVWPADDFDLEVGLDRQELAELLDLALAYLPPHTRDLLIQRYIEESPPAEIAQRLGVSENALSMRLNRGRLLLRRVLTEQLRDESAAFDLDPAGAASWHGTRIWCPCCGMGHLLARLAGRENVVAFRCPVCSPHPSVIGWQYTLANASFAHLIGDVTRPKTIMRKMARWAYEYFGYALDGGTTSCSNCGALARLRYFTEDESDGVHVGAPGVYVFCAACGEVVSSSLGGMILTLPQVQQFWRTHSRIRIGPARALETAGRLVHVATVESVAGASKLDVIVAHDTLQVLQIGEEPQARER